MAGSISGLGGQPQAFQASQSQQAPQSAQQSQGENVREAQEQQETRSNRVQPQGAPTNESQNAETNNEDVTRQAEFSVANDRQTENDPSAQRGSLIDIAV